jgi:hypothetical protein
MPVVPCALLLLARLLSAGDAWAGEPMWGNPDFLGGKQGAILPGAWAWPVNGYGGNAVPELYAGLGVGHGLDVRAGLGVDIPVYHRDDGGLYWGYEPPEVSFVDLMARYATSGSFALGIRAQQQGFDGWRFGPEVTFTHAGHVRFTVRPSWIVNGGIAERDYGILSVPVAAQTSLGKRLDGFVELEPNLWPEWVVPDCGGCGEGKLGIESWLDMRAGAWLRLDEGGNHRIGLAVAYRLEDTLAPVHGLSFGLRYRAGLHL